MLKKVLIGIGIGLIVLLMIVYFYFKGMYNSFVSGSQNVQAQWANVENQYQRRFDLIDNLVETVKGYASHEKETLQAVVEARAKVGQVNINPGDINNPEKFAKFADAQSGLSSALSRLMVVVEQYPNLKANENFLNLQSQLEGTENRIAVERNRYNEAARIYNTTIKKFPNVIFANMFGFSEFQFFKADAAAAQAPKVKF